MGKLSKQAIEEFQTLYKKIMKKDISFDEAALKADHLMRIYMLALPIKIKKTNTDLNSSPIDEARTNKKSNR